MPQDKPARQHLLGWIYHVLLVNISILILPASVIALFYNYAAQTLCPPDALRKRIQRSSRFKPQTILITGVSTPAGLRAARALYATGHNVVGVEAGEYTILNYARWSKAVGKFYSVPTPTNLKSNAKHAERLLRIIVKEKASLWIDCSDGKWAQAQAQARGMVEARLSCACLVPTLEQIQQFETQHGFRELAGNLGLPTPDTHTVRSRNDIFNVLNVENGKRYMLTSPNGTSEPRTRTILPRRTVSQTYSDVAVLKLTKGTSWTLEEYTDALPRYTACGILVYGKVTVFTVASISARGDSKAMHAKSGLSDAMQQYMESFAAAIGHKLSSHMTMEFCLDERATQAGVVQQLLPLSGQLIPHESLLLFQGKRGSIELTRAYTSLLSDGTTELEAYTGLPYRDSRTEIVMPGEPDIGVYFLFKDLRGLVVEPLLRLLALRGGISTVAHSWIILLHHLVAWQEALYDFGDPLPLFWYTHVYAPCSLITDLVQQAWSRIGSGFKKGLRVRHSVKPVQNGR